MNIESISLEELAHKSFKVHKTMVTYHKWGNGTWNDLPENEKQLFRLVAGVVLEVLKSK